MYLKVGMHDLDPRGNIFDKILSHLILKNGL